MTHMPTPVQPVCVHLEDVRRACAAIKAIVRLSQTAESESHDLTNGIVLLCDRACEKTRATEAALQLSPDPAPAAPPRPGFHDTNGTSLLFTVRGAPWTIDRLIHWTHAVEQQLDLLHTGDSYDTWRADLADAGIGIDPTDEWPRIRRRLTAHWERLESDYARRWWAHDWYTRLLDRRPCGWPDDEA